MSDTNTLKKELSRIDGKGYGAYKDIRGRYDLGGCELFIDHVQSDPYAPPSKIRIRVSQKRAAFPKELFKNPIRKTALEDYLSRAFIQEINREKDKKFRIEMDVCGQEVLERTSMRVNSEQVEARLAVGLPAKGRRIMGRQAADLLSRELPLLAERAMLYASLDAEKIKRHVQTIEDQEYLRPCLQEKGLIAFVGNGAMLARASGVSDRPLENEDAVSFSSPPEMETEFELPNKGKIKGMGIPAGVTVIVGGGYHGKSTLLKALERGVYNHIPGDGREWVVSDKSAVKIRAEDGRAVTGADISPFINSLPGGQSTEFFTSSNASGSTSQAANIVEALESGTGLILVDEDTSATNFMIRDSRMQALVAKENEPITPFIDRIRELYTELNVSTVVVMGGSGDYLGKADTVIMLKNYTPGLVTETAREIVEKYPQERKAEIQTPLKPVSPRRISPESFYLGPKDKVGAKGKQTIRFKKQPLELNLLEQLVHESQTRSIAAILRILPNYLKKNENLLLAAVEQILGDIQTHGLEILAGNTDRHPGNLAEVRKQEIMAAINRFRNLKVKQAKQ
ncbi:MAG: ABC-ATPase domain-containing protein [Desulfonatronovibrionaceae bacterium]